MILALLVGFANVTSLQDTTSDRNSLIKGVDTLIAPGALPGAVVATKTAFVVLHTGDMPTVAAGAVGKGRAMVAGHGGFFNPDALKNPSNAHFFANTLTWLSRKPLQGLRVGTVGFSNIATSAQELGAIGVPLDRQNLATQLNQVDVLFLEQQALDGETTTQKAVVSWIKAGHGFFSAGPAWGWQQLNPNKTLRTDLSIDQMLLPYGLALSGDFASGDPVAQGGDDPLLQSDLALAALRKGGLSPAETTRASGNVGRELSLSSLDGKGLVAEIGRLAELEGNNKWPITQAMPFSRLEAIVKQREWETEPAAKVKADPCSTLFPGPVPAEARRVTRKVSIDTTVPDWHGLGLYAPPGEVITITVPAFAAASGVGVRIGSHTDTLWETEKWDRFPEISRRWPLNKVTTEVASPYGGTIFIDVPAKAGLGTISVTVEGAVPAPRYVRGVTTKAEWAKMLAEPGGPWVELEAHNIILSVPRSATKDLTDPEPLMAFWDETSDLCHQLYAAPPRPRAERYCVDRQISVGYMHNGYPIMTFEDVATTFTDVKKLRSKDYPWGFYHELGHNFQEPSWTFDGTGEVTNNLFSLYGCEKINGVVHPHGLSLADRKTRIGKYFADGAKFTEWQNDPFLALMMYDQMRETFGWEPFIKVFGLYRSEHLNSETDLAKHDVWMVQMSRATGKNLGPFFTAWGVPTSDAARQSIADLPKWMPSDMPRS